VLELIGGVYTVTIWTKVEGAQAAANEWVPEEAITPKRRGKTFDEIPFVFFGPRDTDPCVDMPPLLDLADVNLSHFRSSADLETGAHYTAIPTAYVTGVRRDENVVLQIGATTAWTLEDASAKADFLEFKGQGLQALENRQKNKEELMAVIGARLLESAPKLQETAAAVRMRHSGEHATLTTIAVSVSEALTQALQWTVWWSGSDVPEDELSITLNQEFFDVQLSAEDRKVLLLEWQSGGISDETYYWNLQRGGVARPDVEFEAERKLIEAQTPEPIAPIEPKPPVPNPKEAAA
jgi:hypothetical protein